MRTRCLTLGLAVVAHVAHAQPVTQPDSAPLAEIRDEKALAQALATITQDPAVRTDDPKARPVAAALMAEGVRQLQARAFEQALANFLEAYAKFPSPKILLNIASTLREMNRLADAANTYQRYLGDPATGPERVEEVKKLLVDLDTQLTILTVRVEPKGSELSIDGGPFIAVGSSLTTRVRPGLHLVRIRKDSSSHEVTVNGFDGELKDVVVALPAIPTAPARPLPTVRTAEDPPDQVFGWLDSSTQYGTDDVTSGKRQVKAGYNGPVVVARMPEAALDDDSLFVVEPTESRRIRSGAVAVMRIDGKGRGVAGGIGIAIAPLDRLELELALLRSNQWGAYTGVRVRFLTGWVRPYAAGGLPAFLYDDQNDAMRTKVAFGLRAAAGVELRINGHLSVKADAGMEWFINLGDDVLVDGRRPERTLLVPTLGVVGRL